MSQTGDLWCLGRHRLLCGDSTVAADVERVLGGVEPHLMVTDPPYGFEYDPAWRNRAAAAGSIGQKKASRAIGVVTNDDQADWREAWMLFPGDVAYVWHAGTKAAIVQSSLEASGLLVPPTLPLSRRARARERVGDGNQRPWPADRVERWSIDRLIPYAKNARTHTDAAIAASIKEWGWTTPALVGEDGGLIAGHARILAARQLGIAEIPVMVAAGWSGAPPCGQPACAGQSQRRTWLGRAPLHATVISGCVFPVPRSVRSPQEVFNRRWWARMAAACYQVVNTRENGRNAAEADERQQSLEPPILLRQISHRRLSG